MFETTNQYIYKYLEKPTATALGTRDHGHGPKGAPDGAGLAGELERREASLIWRITSNQFVFFFGHINMGYHKT